MLIICFVIINDVTLNMVHSSISEISFRFLCCLFWIYFDYYSFFFLWGVGGGVLRYIFSMRMSCIFSNFYWL